MDLEDAFGMEFPDERIYYSKEELKLSKLPPVQDPTIGEMYSRICALIHESERPIPADSWARVQKCVANVLAVKTDEVRPESHLFSDLGAS